MGYRSDREALRQQKEALEHEVADLRAALERERQSAEPDSAGGERPAEIGRHTSLLAPLVLAVALVALAVLEAGPPLGAVLAALLLVPLIVFAVVKRQLVVAAPHEALVVTGSRHRLADGSVRNWRLARGRVVRVPILQQVERVDLRAMPLVIASEGAHARGGALVDAVLHAIVRISSDPGILPNAVERFLGRPLEQVQLAARQTLEASVRSVIAQLTPEELALDRLVFAEKLSQDAEPELEKLGVELLGAWLGEVSDRGGILRVRVGRQVVAAETRANEAERARRGG